MSGSSSKGISIGTLIHWIIEHYSCFCLLFASLFSHELPRNKPMVIRAPSDFYRFRLKMEHLPSAAGQMLPYLHFTTSDTLWFRGWVPKSAGAMVGTCIGLFLLALVDRWLAACRAVIEIHWRRRTHTILSNQRNVHSPTESESKFTVFSRIPLLSTRNAPPFIPSHDITRGVLHMSQGALTFAFMLAVMTFEAAFLVAILTGLGVGETFFGRYAYVAAHSA